GENPGELHRALAAWAAGSVEFVVHIRHGQRAMPVKATGEKRPVGGSYPTGPSERCFAAPSSYFPDDAVFALGSQDAPQKRGSAVRLLILNFLSAAAVAIRRSCRQRSLGDRRNHAPGRCHRRNGGPRWDQPSDPIQESGSITRHARRWREDRGIIG